VATYAELSAAAVEREKRARAWCAEQAKSRLLTQDEVREILRLGGDDQARAEILLATFDECCTKAGPNFAWMTVRSAARVLSEAAISVALASP
jgi:hypothetical protein